MTTNQLIQRGFELLISLATMTGVGALKDMSKSINELNVKIGVMVEKTDGLQKAVDNHGERLRLIEMVKIKNK